jgi:hypothetical protein
MTGLLRMPSSLSLAIDNHPTNVALDSHTARIREIMLRLQLLAQSLGLDKDLVVVRIPYTLVELRGAISS